MSHHIIRPTLDELDQDGALREAAERVDPFTRASFLRRAAAIVGGGVLVSAGLPAASAFAAGGTSDTDILNYALTLEYLESAFYASANKNAGLTGEWKRYATTVGEHEDAHVKALKQALGSKATKKPSFDFKGTTSSPGTFASTALTLEDTGVEAYQGQVTNIKAKKVLAAAVSIHPVEARHAAWAASIIGKGSANPNPSPNALNPAKDMAQILAVVQSTGFISTMGSAASSSAVNGQPAMTG